MGKRFPKSLLFLRGFSLCLYTCVYLALAGQSSCSGTGTKTFGNAPGSSTTSSSGAVTVGAPTGSFAGLQSVVSSSFTNAVISVGSFTGSISKIEVFCAYGPSPSPSLAPPAYTSVGTYIPNASNQINLSPIYSGTTHTCYGLPETLSGTEVVIPDARVSVTFKTLSFNQVAYRNVVNARAFGATVNPAASPTARMVDITWQPFSNSQLSATPLPNTQTYAVYRTLKGTFPDVSSSGASANCAASQASGTCKVNCASGSTLSGLFSVRCIDLDVAASPAKYWYYISTLTSVNASPRPEEYPSLPSVSDSPQTLSVATYPKVSSTITPSNQAYLVNVPIPPGEMVLVHRDSANFEFCNLIQKSNQLDTFAAQNGVGHLFHNRCLFNGLGARPVNTNPYGAAVTIPGVANGIQTYDFGYNLFIDRYEAGCNWTPASQGGMCGAGGTTGDCVGQAVQYTAWPYWYSKPRDDVGVNGNIFLATHYASRPNGSASEQGATCWIKVNNSWTMASEAIPAISNALISTLYTAAPVHNLVTPNASLIRPPLIVNQSGAASVCSNQTVSGYGGFKKRLLRRREFMAASAWPTNQYESSDMRVSPVQLNQLRSSSASSTDVNFSRKGCYQPFYNGLNATNYVSTFPGWTSGMSSQTPTFPNPAANASFFNTLVDLTNNSGGISSSSTSSVNGLPRNTLGFFVSNSNPGWGDTNGAIGSGPGPIAIGSTWSQNCVSRFGAQDLLGNIGEWNSEEMICDSSGCREVTSRFDDGATLGTVTFDGSSGQGPLLKNPNWFINSALNALALGWGPQVDAYNVQSNAAPGQPASRSLSSSTHISNTWLQSQFQVMSIGPTPIPFPTPGDTLAPGTKSYTSYFHPALGLPAQDAANESIDSSLPAYGNEFLGVKSFSIMNGIPNSSSSIRVGIISGSPVSNAMAFKPNGSSDTIGPTPWWWYSFSNATKNLESHATRWAPVFEHENGMTGAMLISQPAKGFRCSFSPDLSADP